MTTEKTQKRGVATDSAPAAGSVLDEQKDLESHRADVVDKNFFKLLA